MSRSDGVAGPADDMVNAVSSCWRARQEREEELAGQSHEVLVRPQRSLYPIFLTSGLADDHGTQQRGASAKQEPLQLLLPTATSKGLVFARSTEQACLGERNKSTMSLVPLMHKKSCEEMSP